MSLIEDHRWRLTDHHDLQPLFMHIKKVGWLASLLIVQRRCSEEKKAFIFFSMLLHNRLSVFVGVCMLTVKCFIHYANSSPEGKLFPSEGFFFFMPLFISFSFLHSYWEFYRMSGKRRGSSKHSRTWVKVQGYFCHMLFRNRMLVGNC